jgi:hypothetical protein
MTRSEGGKKGLGIAAVGHTDDCRFVLFIQVDDQISGLEGPDKAHAPLGIGLTVVHETKGFVGCERPIETALVEDVGGGDGPVLGELRNMEGVVFHEEAEWEVFLGGQSTKALVVCW